MRGFCERKDISSFPAKTPARFLFYSTFLSLTPRSNERQRAYACE